MWDPWGRGQFRDLDVTRPIILLRIPELKIDSVLRIAPLTAAVAVLKTFPPDPRAHVAAARHAGAVRAVLAPYRGAWRFRGDGARSTFGTRRVTGPDDPLDWPGAPGTCAGTATQLVIEPDGRLRQWSHDTPFTLTDGGRRLERPGTDEWWERETTVW